MGLDDIYQALDLLSIASRSDEPGVIADADIWEAVRTVARRGCREALGAYWRAASSRADAHLERGTRRAMMSAALLTVYRAYGLVSV